MISIWRMRRRNWAKSKPESEPRSVYNGVERRKEVILLKFLKAPDLTDMRARSI
jgi:hypothetical protein